MSFLGDIGFPGDGGEPSEIEDQSRVGRDSETEDRVGETIEARVLAMSDGILPEEQRVRGVGLMGTLVMATQRSTLL